MDQPDNQDALIKIKEQIRKQDQSIKISFLPNQVFLGNHTLELAAPEITISYNRRNKLSLRVSFAADPSIGYKQVHAFLSLAFIDRISLMDEHQELSPVIIIHLTNGGFEKLCHRLTGLKEVVEGPHKRNKNSAKSLIFVLSPFTADPDTIVKIIYADKNEINDRFFEFEVAKSIFKNEIASVWSQYFVEKVARHRESPVSKNGSNIQVVESRWWSTFLSDVGLIKDTLNETGFARYKKNLGHSKNHKLSIHVNSEEYSKGKAARIPTETPHREAVTDPKKISKKRKLLENDIHKHTCWVNREGWVPDFVERAKKVAMSHNFGNRDTGQGALVFKNEIPIGDTMRVEKNNCENENILAKEKNFDEAMDFNGLVLQDINSLHLTPHQNLLSSHPYNHVGSETNDVDIVTASMSHLGEESYNFNTNNYMTVYNQNWPLQQAQYGTNNQLGDVMQFQSPSLIQNQLSQPPSVSVKEKRTVDTITLGNERLFQFPPAGVESPGKDHITVEVKDVRTLDRKEFINDNVMGFMLTYIWCYMIDEELYVTVQLNPVSIFFFRKKKVHMYNTFFYSNLTKGLPPLCYSQRKPITADNESILKGGIQRCARWTRSMDLFTKDYIIIPINEDLHWMVIAIINPAGAIVDMSDEENSRNAPKTYMLFFDPLSGLDPSRRNHMCYCVKKFVLELYASTKAPGKKFASGKQEVCDETRIIDIRPNNAPIQDNFYDCGLYVLHFVEGLFCSPKRPVTVNDFPEFDWSEFYPEAHKMCDVMRDKVYNLILGQSNKLARSRLSLFEKACKVGLSREGKLRKSRRHSAADHRRIPRHEDHYPRHFSLNPPNRNVILDDPTFTNPRALALMPLTQRVRSLRIPEENFPIAY
ncbi:CRE-ULP-2 protein [Caenorhabditis remanei]|uniref:CRE-ULP-2 protein n=1 Tax=Caenorhabditis remanei TaxID=31234 RepID=E3M4A7_CAERE|nr:CRE-ULP-2 protein [Caenorhabditis remanei]